MLLAATAGTTDAPGRTQEWARQDVGLTTDIAAAAQLETTRDISRLGASGVRVSG